MAVGRIILNLLHHMNSTPKEESVKTDLKWSHMRMKYCVKGKGIR